MERQWPTEWVRFAAKPVRKGKDLVVMIPPEIVEKYRLKANDCITLMYDSPTAKHDPKKKALNITKLS